MIHVVLDTEAPIDEFSDARTRPQVGRKAVGKSATQERLLESSAFRRAQLRRSTGGWERTNSGAPLGIEARTPTSHGATIDTHPTSNFDGQQAFLQQIERAQAAALQFDGTSGRAHGFPPVQEYGTLLMQASIVPIVHDTTYEALREVSPLLGSRSGLSTAEEPMADVAAKLAELVTI